MAPTRKVGARPLRDNRSATRDIQEGPCRLPPTSRSRDRLGSSSPIRTPPRPRRPKPRSRACASSPAAGAGCWSLATAATILLCINQQFTLRFFIGYTQLNTEYYYLLILCMLPFTFLIFPASTTAPLDRVPWYDVVLFLATIASAVYLMLNVRKAAELGWEFGGAPMRVIVGGPRHVGAADGGAAPHRRLEPAAERAALHRLPAVCRGALARTAQGQQSTLEQATAYHVLSSESLLGIPIQAFADTVIGFLVFGTALMMTGAGKFFINLAFALCGTFRGGAAKVGIFASGLLGMMSGSIVSNVLTAGTMTIPVMKRTGFRASYAAAIEACASTGAVLAPPVMGATAFVIAQFLNVSYAEVALAAIIPAVLYYLGLFMQVDAYAARHNLKGMPRAELPSAWLTHQGGLVLPASSSRCWSSCCCISSARATRRSMLPRCCWC